MRTPAIGSKPSPEIRESKMPCEKQDSRPFPVSRAVSYFCTVCLFVYLFALISS